MIRYLIHLKNSLLLTIFSASSAFAASTIPQTPKNVAEMACIVTKLALSFVPYIVVIAVGAFLMGLIKYVAHGDNEEKRSEGIKMMVYGTLGFFFMVSIWSILRLSANSFGLELLVPQFNSGGTNFSSTCNKV